MGNGQGGRWLVATAYSTAGTIASSAWCTCMRRAIDGAPPHDARRHELSPAPFYLLHLDPAPPALARDTPPTVPPQRAGRGPRHTDTRVPPRRRVRSIHDRPSSVRRVTTHVSLSAPVRRGHVYGSLTQEARTACPPILLYCVHVSMRGREPERTHVPAGTRESRVPLRSLPLASRSRLWAADLIVQYLDVRQANALERHGGELEGASGPSAAGCTVASPAVPRAAERVLRTRVLGRRGVTPPHGGSRPAAHAHRWCASCGRVQLLWRDGCSPR